MEAVFIIIGGFIGAGIMFFVKPNQTDNAVIEEERQKALNQAEKDFEIRKQELIASLSQQYQAEANQKIADTEKEFEAQIQNYQNQITELETTISNSPPIERSKC